MTHSDQVNIFFCLDVSESILKEKRQAAEAFINKAAGAMQNGDQAGVIVFGESPSLEISLSKEMDSLNIRSEVNPNYTNLHDALQLAIGKLPQRGKNKILLFSDGNETIHRALDTAYLAKSLGIEIYPVPLATWFGKNEAFVKELATPPSVALETPFEIRLVVISSKKNQAELVCVRNGNLLVQQPLALETGLNVFTFSDKLIDPGLYLYKAVVNFAEDTFFQNNEGISFTKGTQKARILYLTENDLKSAHLAETLQVQGLDIDRKHIKDIPGAIHGFVDHNAIILDNVSGRSISLSTMEQIEKYVKDTGGGLIMIGGDKSFGAGYYNGTPVEKTLPVYMDTPTDISVSELYLIFVIDKSSSMTSSYKDKSKLEMAKIAAFSSIEMLNPMDNIGIVVFDTQFEWVVPLTAARERQKIAERLSRVAVGGGTDLYPALKEVERVLKRITSGKKHVIVLSDGETEAADFQSLVQPMNAEGITISTVSIGQGSNVALMKSIAEWGKGRAYYTDDPGTIPRIFAGETKIISKKTITEKAMQPFVKKSGEMLQGLDNIGLPLIYGQVVTYAKPGADLLIETEQGPLLAAWQYGLGRSAAFTSDLANRWGKDWVKWENYGRFVSQMVKWVQRKEASRHFSATMDRRGEKGTFTVDITTDQNRFVNHLDLETNVLLPSGQDQTFAMEQIAPGRYAGKFPAAEIGAYFFSVYSRSHIAPDPPRAFGFGIPYTEEFNTTAVNAQLLEDLAATTSGRVLSVDDIPADLFTDVSDSKEFKTPLWPYFILAFLLLLVADVAARKFLALFQAGII
ncbi:MAG: VWA domain-containing protein [Desulfobacterales bacterium]|nr:MAG: VWA domain-containing protein [Desulfobacterales bacterium]